MAESERVVTGGVDSHKDVNVAACIDEVGRILGSESFPTTQKGCRQLERWLCSFGDLSKVGVEGTGSYGFGIGQHLASGGVEVVEVNRPDRKLRRRHGKTDFVDAEAAARAALNMTAEAVPKTRNGIIESIRVLRVAFTSARKSHTVVANQIADLLITAPAGIRERLEPMPSNERADLCAAFRPAGSSSDPVVALRMALRTLGRRYLLLADEIAVLRSELTSLTAEANPALVGAVGVGADVAAELLIAAGDNPERMTSESSYAALCGASPVEASSGKVIRHRVNMGGNRQANNGLWRIALVRMVHDPRTKTYVAKRRAEGKSSKEIIRCLMRAIAREVYRLITNPPEVPFGPELRAQRANHGLILADVAQTLGTNQNKISRLERGLIHDTNLATRYQTWLNTHKTD